MADVIHAGELLSAYVDGELLGDELNRVAIHLETCLPCVSELRDIQHAKRALRSLPALEPPDSVARLGHLGDLLSAYLDGELDREESATVSRHLDRCALCKSELGDLDKARAAIRSLPTLELPALLDVERVVRRPSRAVAWAAAVAVAVVLVAGVSTSSQPTPTFDIDTFAARHSARQSVETGIQVVPALAPAGVTP